MSLRRAAWLLGWGLLLPPACGPDPEPPAACGAVADFQVTISAAGGELPSDTVVVLIYGSGREEYQLSNPETPEVLFCTPVDSEGREIEVGEGGEGGEGGETEGGAGGAGRPGGGAGGAHPTPATEGVPALRCMLYTQGPATLEISAGNYGELREEFELRRGLCTVEAKVELMRGDAGP